MVNDPVYITFEFRGNLEDEVEKVTLGIKGLARRVDEDVPTPDRRQRRGLRCHERREPETGRIHTGEHQRVA